MWNPTTDEIAVFWVSGYLRNGVSVPGWKRGVETMATVSMTKGAELAGVSKGTVSKAIKSGRRLHRKD
jgi:hypothetical protein